MSLVNDMLKNLEKRQAQTQRHYEVPHADTEEPSMSIKILIIFALLLLLVIAGFTGWYYTKHPIHFSLTLKKAEKTKIIPHVISSPAAANNQITVSMLHINDLNHQTEITLDLNAVTTFVTNSDPIHNSESITLEKTKLDLPALCKQLNQSDNCLIDNEIPLSFIPSTIKSIRVDQNDHEDLTLSFQLISPAQLESAHFSGNHLLLIFSKTPKNITSSTNSINESVPPPLPVAINAGPSDSMILQPATPTVITPDNERFDRIYNLILLKKLDQAQAAISQLTTEEQQSTRGLMVRAKLQLALGNNARALAILKAYTFGDETPNLDFYALYAATLAFNDKYAEATTLYRNLVKHSPTNTTWLLGLGVSALKSNQDALAQEAFQKLLAIGDPNPEVTAYVQKQIELLDIDNT